MENGLPTGAMNPAKMKYSFAKPTAAAKKMTSFGKGMGWNLCWSPDSKKIAFIDDRQEINSECSRQDQLKH